MNREFLLERDTLSLVNKFLTHNESSKMRNVSRDFRDSVDHKIRYEQEIENISNIYQVGEHNKLGIILDKDSKNIYRLEYIAKNYGSFDLLPLSGSNLNLIKFDKIIRYKNKYEKRFYSFPKIVSYSMSSGDYYIDGDIKLNNRNYEVISETKTRLAFHFQYEGATVDYEVFIKYMIKDDEEFTEIIRYEDDGTNKGKYVDKYILYNENIFLCIYLVDDKLYEYSFYKFSDIKTINCYLFDKFPVFDYLTNEEEHIVIAKSNNNNLKQNYYMFGSFVLDLDTQKIKVLGDYDGKYIIDKNRLDKIEDSDKLLKLTD
jgi:hypothetical protein